MTTPKTPARLDADRTAQPRTRIVHHPPHGSCIGPYMPLVNPEYEDENGKRTALMSEPQAHDLTPSEVALAKIFVAWETCPEGSQRTVLGKIGVVLNREGYTVGPRLSNAARALVDRARKAGAL